LQTYPRKYCLAENKFRHPIYKLKRTKNNPKNCPRISPTDGLRGIVRRNSAAFPFFAFLQQNKVIDRKTSKKVCFFMLFSLK
jgi:hypothetical protein